MKIPILTYHSIDRSGSVISTAPETFRRQMTFLSEAGYRVVSLGELIERLDFEMPSSEKIVALTFDDGFQNFYREAFSILMQYHFRATVFLITDFCGKSNDWADNPPNLPRSPLLSWSEIKELNRHGVEFGAHTRRHHDLTELSTADAVDEMRESKSEIENRLGCAARTFAYPYGKFNEGVRRAAKNLFDAACSTNLGKASSNDDFHALSRIDSYYLSNPVIFDLLLSKNFDFYLSFRQNLRDLKSRVQRGYANQIH